MSEVETIPTTTEAESKPTIEKADIAAALGVDVADLDKLANLKSWERDLNKTSSELGALRKQVDESRKPEDDEPELDEASEKALRKYVTKILGVDPDELAYAVRKVKQDTEETLKDTITGFFAENTNLKEDDVFAVLAELPPMPTDLKPKDAKKLLNLAKDILAYRASAKDTEAQEAKVLEKAEQLIEAQQKDGAEVIGIKKKAAPADAKRSLVELAAEKGDFWSKMEAFSPAS